MIMFEKFVGGRLCIQSRSVSLEIFKCMLKIIQDCIRFAILCSVIGLENLRHHLNQSEEKLTAS